MASSTPLAAALEVALALASVACADPCVGSLSPGTRWPVAVAVEVGTLESLAEETALFP
jgi:hypothetical protein